MMLKCVLCGRFTEVVSSTNMWFSSGGTKSVLHNDDADNINCILSGKKEFFMAHKVRASQPYPGLGNDCLFYENICLLQKTIERERDTSRFADM